MEEMLAGLMFLVAFFLIFLGFPVAFSLGGAALIFAFIGVEQRLFNWAFMSQFHSVWWHYVSPCAFGGPIFHINGNDAGKVEACRGLLTTIGVLFGRVRGGLALAVIFVRLYWLLPRRCGSFCCCIGMMSMPVI